MQSAKHGAFQFDLSNCRAIGASAFVPRGRAAVMCRGNLRHAAAALAAGEQERKQVFGPFFVPKTFFVVHCFLQIFHPVPQRIVDDAQVRHIGAHPCGLVIHAAIFTASIRVFEEALFTPNLFADVKLIVENARPTTTVAVYRAGSPIIAVLPANAFGIQFMRNLARRLAAAIFLKDAADDGRLFLIDFAHAADAIALGIIARLNVIAVAFAARAFTVQRALF